MDDIVVGFAPHEMPTIPKTWREIRRDKSLLDTSQLRIGTSIYGANRLNLNHDW